MNQRPMTSFGSLTDLSRQSNMWVMSMSLPSFPTLVVLTFLTSAFNLQNQMRLRCFDVFQQGFPQRKWDLCKMKWPEKKIHTHFQHYILFFHTSDSGRYFLGARGVYSNVEGGKVTLVQFRDFVLAAFIPVFPVRVLTYNQQIWFAVLRCFDWFVAGLFWLQAWTVCMVLWTLR